MALGQKIPLGLTWDPEQLTYPQTAGSNVGQGTTPSPFLVAGRIVSNPGAQTSQTGIKNIEMHLPLAAKRSLRQSQLSAELIIAVSPYQTALKPCCTVCLVEAKTANHHGLDIPDSHSTAFQVGRG